MIEKWLWELLPSSFKTSNKEPEDTDIYKLLETWASAAEGFRQSAFSARRQKFPELSDDKVLYLLGKEKNLEKFPNESLDEFRERIKKSVAFWFQAGSVETLKEVLDIYGFKNVEIKRVEDPIRWAEFRVEVTSEKEITPETRDLAITIITKLNPAHEKLSEILLSYLATGSLPFTIGQTAEIETFVECQTDLTWMATGQASFAVSSFAETEAVAIMEA
ncbi:MAG: phage tail protein [Desulfurobacteriaceae bacterium]